MEPIFGFILFFIASAVVSVVAGKRNGAGIGFLYFVIICAVGFGLVVLIANITERNSVLAGLAAFLSPVIALVLTLSTATSERLAVIHGESGEYKKCHFCAESVRKEAIKCKHCGSDL